MTLHSCKTELNGRTLWFDGHSTVLPSNIQQMLVEGITPSKLHTTEITPEIEQYNKFVPKSERIDVKRSCEDLVLEWNIPDEYKNLDIIRYMNKCFTERCGHLSGDEYTMRVVRLGQELTLYKRLDLFDFLRTIIYVINTLSETNKIWGVGRGSSVSSFVLYLIGVHDVDSVAYDLDVSDFLKS